MECMLDFALKLAAAMAGWPDQKKEGLEGAREACRHVALHVGVTEDTASLCDLWLGITRAQVMVNGFAGGDITAASMGVPGRTLDLEHLRTLPPGQKLALRSDLNMLAKMLPELQDFYPNLIMEARIVCEDALRMVE